MMNTIEQFNCLSYLGNQELRKSGKIEKKLYTRKLSNLLFCCSKYSILPTINCLNFMSF